MRELAAALSAFAAYRQFIIYRVEPSQQRPGRTDKIPVDPRSGRWPVSAHDPAIWLDHVTAFNIANAWGEPYGAGFVFTEADPFWFLDADHCLTETGWSAESQRLAQLLQGCAIEVSISGEGLHYFGTGKPPSHGCRNDSLGLEFYHSGRFAALGNGAVGSAATDCSVVLAPLIVAYFPPGAYDGDGDDVEWTETAEGTPIPDDDELIRRALQSRSSSAAFGKGAAFADLWFANVAVLCEAYPDPARDYDASKADAALAQHLAFWTGKNCERIRALMLRSQLARDKWERNADIYTGPGTGYLIRTIKLAVGRQVDVYQHQAAAASPTGLLSPTDAPTVQEATILEGSRILGADTQIPLFCGCVYIQDSNRALVAGGHLLKPDQFRVIFGGRSFVMERDNSRMTRDAWEAFTQSQLLSHPKANGTCFRPDLPASAIVTRNGQSFVNTFVPVDVPRRTGDPAPFLDHLRKVLPNEQDTLILLSYMAACIQHKGTKFQWAPLLQGVEGNGKTLFTRCVAEAIGKRYVHWPKASKLAKEFNAWMVGKLFFAVEDIYVPDHRREVIEELKPMITGGDGLEIEAKGVDQTSADICGNFMFNSNHRTAITKTANNRIFCVLFSAQQQMEHLKRDGMDGDYFPNLYRWLRADGYAIVSDYLHRFEIPAELNPAKDCPRAPISSTTADAISSSRGTVEQEILERIEQGLTGFAGGWVSSIYLDRLLQELGYRKISHSSRHEIMENLSYVYHPALREGRTNNPVLPDGSKPRLYVRKDSLLMQLTDPKAVASAYETANRNAPVVALPFRGDPKYRLSN